MAHTTYYMYLYGKNTSILGYVTDVISKNQNYLVVLLWWILQPAKSIILEIKDIKL